MASAGIAFKFVNYRPIDQTEVNCNLVFDVKIDFTCKARYVAGVNLTSPPDNFHTYSSVISCKSVRILFLIAALYDIRVLAADISNAFINAKCVKKVFLKAEPEFKSREGMSVIILRTLYGLKSARASFRAHLSNILWTMGFKPTFYDRTMWMHNNFLPLPQ